MSTSPDVVQTLSRWLAGHADVGQVREALAYSGGLGPESQDLVEELRDERDPEAGQHHLKRH